MPYSPSPTPLQDVLNYISRCQSQGYTPSTRELGAHFGKSDIAARYWIKQLEKDGRIKRVPGTARRLIIQEQRHD